MKKLIPILTLAMAPILGNAALLDEVKVHDDTTAPIGHHETELHINTTPSGISTPSYAGEIMNNHGTRVTPEISYGLTKNVEAALLIPVVAESDATLHAAGLRARIKWMPLKAEDNQGFFAGINLQYGQVGSRFNQDLRNMEVKGIVGWKNPNWLISVNPALDYKASSSLNMSAPELLLSTKVSYRIGESNWLGWEQYSDMGPRSETVPYDQQNRVNYAVFDHKAKHMNYSLGVGKGATSNSDNWTVKATVDLPF